MATSLGLKQIARVLDHVLIRGRRGVVRIAPEGVYIKRERERWGSAYFVPWMAVYSVGAKMKLDAKKKEKAAKRKARRSLL